MGLSRQDSGISDQADSPENPCLSLPGSGVFDEPQFTFSEQVDDESERPDIGVRFCGAVTVSVLPERFDNPAEPGGELREAVFGFRIETVFEGETSAFDEIVDGRMLFAECLPGLGEEL